ncbi:MAG: hypothetical protein QM765_28560 [Myxococcales bacterium]
MPLEAELDGLGRAVLEALRAHPEEFGAARAAKTGPVQPAPHLGTGLVLESETGLFLGEAPARSLSLAIPVYEPFEARVWTFGPDFAPSAEPRDFLQILVAQMPAPATRVQLSRMASLRSLARRAPGWFAHSDGSATGVRVHRQLLASGFAQAQLADALVAQFRDEPHPLTPSPASRRGGTRTPAPSDWGCATTRLRSVAVAVGIPSARALELMRPFAERLAQLKDSLVPSERGQTGALEVCEGKDCRSCDEAVVCDKVREVLAADRAKKGTREP